MDDVYTYFYPDSRRDVSRGPLQGKGRVWVRGEYQHPDFPDPLVVRVGEAGVKVWMVMQWLESSGYDFDVLQRRYGAMFAPEDIDAARWFYEQNKAVFEQKLREEKEAAAR